MAATKTTNRKTYIYSTLTASQDYTTWKPMQEGQMVREALHKVTIHGGANVANKHLITPKGVVTAVTESDFEHLEKNDQFQFHLARGYLSVEHKNLEIELVVSKGMKAKDESAPVTPADYKKLQGREDVALPQERSA